VVNQVKFTQMKIEPDEKVVEKIETIDTTQKVSTVTIQTENKADVVAPVEEKGTTVVEKVEKAPEDDNQIFRKVEIEAEFPGGEGKWRSYLERTLNPNAPVDNGASPGKYTVMVEFIVSKDGSLSDVHATNKVGFGMEEEAVRVIKKGPKWTPAQQNGRQVNAYRTQPITFQVNEE
ncbi:MAG: energy transducer TonB, partial [Ferruginibacter sp.]